MVGLSSRDLLDVSDAGASLDWTSRGILLAGCAWPQASAEDCAALPVGVRDRLVMALRLRTFGGDMLVRFTCRSCQAQMEARVDLAALLAAHAAEPPSRIVVDVDGATVGVRLPTSADVLAIAALPADRSAVALFERCLESPVAADSALVRARVAEALAVSDPLASVELELECQACHHRSSELFDIVSSFWREVEAGARRAAADVHALASAYGWTEDVILSMAPTRRARYLAMTQS